MRVLLTVHRYWPSIGGTEAFVGGLAAELAKRGLDVTVATSEETGAPAVEERDGVKIHRFPIKRAGKFRFPGRDYRRFVGRQDWDLLNVHGQRVWSADYAYDVYRRTKVPLVWMPHGFYQYHMNKRTPLERLYYHKALHYAFRDAHMICETRGEIDELVRFGFRRERCHLISSSLDVAQFMAPHKGFRAKYGYSPDEPLLLYVGGLYVNKGVEDVVRIAARTGYRAAVIGRDPDPSGANLARCKALADELKAPVAFLGKIPWEDVLSAYQEATVFLLASKFEGYGLVLLEAMSSGLPFVASRAGAGPDLAELGVGASVPTWEDMARETQRIVEDPALRRRMSETARRLAPNYTWDKVIEGVLDAYDGALRDAGKPTTRDAIRARQ